MRCVRAARSLFILPLIAVLSGLALGENPSAKPLSERVIEIAPTDATPPAAAEPRERDVDVRRFGISPDGRWIASKDASGKQLEFWDATTGKSAGRFGEVPNPVALAFSPNSQQLATAAISDNGNFAVELWHVDQRSHLQRLDGDAALTPFSALAFAADGKSIALGATPLPQTPMLSERSAAARAALGQPPSPPSSPSGSEICLWSSTSGDELRRLEPLQIVDSRGTSTPSRNTIDALAWSPDGRLVAAVMLRHISVWEVASGSVRVDFGSLPWVAVKGDPVVPTLSFSPDGRYLAGSGEDGTVRLWDVTDGRALPPLVHGKEAVRTVVFAAAGDKLFSLGVDNRLVTWSAAARDLDWRPVAEKLSPETLESLWRDFLADEPRAKFFAKERLIASPEQAMSWAKERIASLKPPAGPDASDFISDLASEDINLRKQAIQEKMEKLGEPALAYLEAIRSGRVRPDKVPVEGLRVRLVQRLEKQVAPQRREMSAAVQLLMDLPGKESEAVLTELSQGKQSGFVVRMAQSALQAVALRQKPALREDSPEGRWKELGNEDARVAHAALQQLTSQGDASVAMLRTNLQKLAPSQALDVPQQIAQLIRELDHEEFAIRERASTQLANFGSLATLPLRAALEKEPTAEAKQRIINLLSSRSKPKPMPERMQVARGLEVLEHIGTAEAKQALASIAKSAPADSWVAQTAKESAERVAGRTTD